MLALVLAGFVCATDGLLPSVSAPAYYVRGEPYVARITLQAGSRTERAPVRLMSAALFTVDGRPLSEGTETNEGEILLGPHASLTIDLDLGPLLAVERDFELRTSVPCAAPFGADGMGQRVTAFERAPQGIDYLGMAAGALAAQRVLLVTNRGAMLFELWPDSAPNHVRNFLDLCAAGFYDGLLFHRVVPGFMIQGGDPQTKDPASDPRRWGAGNGPRKLQAEFSAKKHVRGVLSMARLGQDPHSATSQFFVVHMDSTNLDRQYSAFGRLIEGSDVLDRIATCNMSGIAGPVPNPPERPKEPQRIERALVLRPLVPAAK
jgi:peptidyl-prolyl cis-trans isomerase B (cyclophilin B)